MTTMQTSTSSSHNTSTTYSNDTAPFDRPLRRISAQLDLSSLYIPPIYPDPGASPGSPSSSLHSQASRISVDSQGSEGAGGGGGGGADDIGNGAGEGVVWLRSNTNGR